MAASLAKLCLAAALAQQVFATEGGPLPFMPSVGIALYKGCAEKTADIHEDEAIEDVHGASCDQLDADRLTELGVDDCAGTASKLSTLAMTFECVYYTVTDPTTVDVRPQARELCFLPKMGEQLTGCKQGMDKIIEDFTPEPIEKLDPKDASPGMLDSFEFTMGVFGACDSLVESAPEDDEVEAFCAEETDPKSMETMGVTDDDCAMSLRKPLKQMVAAICSMYVGAEMDPSTATGDDINEKVGEFVDHVDDILGQMEEGGVGSAMQQGQQQDPLAKRLRLYSVFGAEKYFGKSLGEALRKSGPLALRSLSKSASWSPVSVAFAAAASASAVTALGLLAWRRHLTKGRPDEIEQILCEQDTQE